MDNGRSWKPCFCSCATAHCSGLPSSFRPWMEGQNEKEYTPEFQYGIRIIESEHLPNYIFNLNLHIQSRNELGLETPLAVGSETLVRKLWFTCFGKCFWNAARQNLIQFVQIWEDVAWKPVRNRTHSTFHARNFIERSHSPPHPTPLFMWATSVNVTLLLI